MSLHSSAPKSTTYPHPHLNHLALIMDGNGRWAEKRGLSRSEGHQQGSGNEKQGGGGRCFKGNTRC